jgi:hypothetical protein
MHSLNVKSTSQFPTIEIIGRGKNAEDWLNNEPDS